MDLDVDELTEMARNGDNDAKLSLALKYAIGRDVPKDLDLAEKLLREASLDGGERPLYHLMRIHFSESDDRIKDVFHERKEWQLPVVYFLYGSWLVSNKNYPEAGIHFKNGYDRGSVPCGLGYYASRLKMSFFPPI